jgi:hypothetical protein
MGKAADECRDAVLRKRRRCVVDSGFSIAWVCLPHGRGHCCCTARPVPVNGLLARATNA